MGRELKIYMRGKGVAKVQELLQAMGYTIVDRPGLFGASTRNAVKDLQLKKGLEATGIVNDQLLAMIDDRSTGHPVPETKTADPSMGSADGMMANQSQVDALVRLLTRKGIITHEELQEEIKRPQPARITQPPLF